MESSQKRKGSGARQIGFQSRSQVERVLHVVARINGKDHSEKTCSSHLEGTLARLTLNPFHKQVIHLLFHIKFLRIKVRAKDQPGER